jgi:hypothetical protein
VGSVYSDEFEPEHVTLTSHVDFQLDVDRFCLASFDCGASAEKAGGKNGHMTPQEIRRVVNFLFIKASFEAFVRNVISQSRGRRADEPMCE